MPYTLSRLAPGSYDVLLEWSDYRQSGPQWQNRQRTWTAELLVDVHPRRRPAPFTEAEHTFGSFEEAQEWLGGAEVRDTAGNT